MKKFTHLLVMSLVLCGMLFTGCDLITSSGSKVTKGSISGKAYYSNAQDASDIAVVLESTDGLRTISVIQNVPAKPVAAREIVGVEKINSVGTYTFSDVENGVYTITAISNNSSDKAVKTNVVVTDGRAITAADLVLTATGNISGQIVVDNQSESNDNLGFLVYIAGTSYMAKTDMQGKFTISDIPAGNSYNLVIEKNTFVYIYSNTVTVTAKTTTSLPSTIKFTSSQLNVSSGSGADGTSIEWKGSFASPEALKKQFGTPKYLWAYFNTTDGCSYIYDGSNWTLLAKAGANGSNGISINWLGSYSNSNQIDNPEVMDAYYNTTDGCSYIYTQYGWTLLAKAGENGLNGENGDDGVSIVWLGSFADATEIDSPELLNAYYNTTDGCSYIYTSEGWSLLARVGGTGAAGASIVWLGSYADADEIDSPELLNVYYNTTDGCSYIYTNYGWTLLAKAGNDGSSVSAGASIVWLGSYTSEYLIESPEVLNVYYNTTTGCSYIYTTEGWTLFAKAGESATPIVWLGSYADEDDITSPELLNAYYNTTDGCSYIYTTRGWTLLAKAGAAGESTTGADGTSIVWLGSYVDEDDIDSPEVLNAYFNLTDGCSYIYTTDGWSLLAKAGNAATPIVWIGSYADEDDIYSPELLNVYYNTTDGCSYIYTSYGWRLLAKAGDAGAPIVWLGSYADEDDIYSPSLLNAYYNTTDGCSYIYTTDGWTLLAKAGEAGASTTGADGASIVWLGSYANEDYIDSPSLLNAYYNTTDGCSYIYTTRGWTLLAKAGQSITGEAGTSIVWLGSYADEEEIESPELMNAYFNTTDGCSYIYTDDGWTLLAKAGEAGASTTGADGASIVWLGSFADEEEIESPELLNAYFNTVDGCSYIYTSDGWTLLAKAGAKGEDGKDGKSLIWKGASDTAPENPKEGYAYYNTSDGNSYIYDGEKWTLLARASEEVIWKGSLAAAPANPEVNWAYYDTVFCKSYVYNGLTWELLPGNNIASTTIIWQGSYTSHPANPSDGWTYYNTISKNTYIYLDGSWQLLASAGISGLDGETSNVVSVDNFATYLEGLSGTGPFVITLQGEMLPTDFENIYSALSSNYKKEVVLDLSQVTGLVNIPNGALSGRSNLKGIALPDSVISIENSAFYGTGLTNVKLNNGLKLIGNSAFYDSTISSIDIPATVTEIGEYAFRSCRNLTSIVIPDSVITIGRGAFYESYKLSSVKLPAGLTSISSSLFYGCSSLSTITIPNTVTSIGDYAFAGSHLAAINIPASVKTIGQDSFNSCNYLVNVTIPSSVVAIGESAFYNCTSLQTIEIPASVASYGNELFEGCTSLKTVTLPDNITKIPQEMFYGCSALESITIPASVKILGKSCFERSGLKSIVVPDTVEIMETRVFASCKSLISVTLPDTLTSIPDSTFYNCESLPSITLPETIVSIGSSAFEGCSALKAITIPASVTSIGVWAFEYCSALKAIVIPEGVVTLGNSMFYGCTSLSSVTLPSGIKEIPSSMFNKCSALKAITIPAGVETIGSSAFEDTEISTITLPAALKVIESYAFEGSALTTIDIPEGVTRIEGAAFARCSLLVDIIIPSTVEEMYRIFYSSSSVYNGRYYMDSLKHVYVCGRRGAPNGWYEDWANYNSSLDYSDKVVWNYVRQ